MTRESILVLIGILVALCPWSGIPLDWLRYALILAGLATAAIGWTLRERRVAADTPTVPVVAEPIEPVVGPEPAPQPQETVPVPAPVPEAPPVPQRRRSIDLPSRSSRIAKF